jgi:hypothetical protein
MIDANAPDADKETALLRAILKQIETAEVSAIQAIGALLVAATGLANTSTRAPA